MNILKTVLLYLAAAALGAAAYHCLYPCQSIRPKDAEQVILRSVVAEILPETLPATLQSLGLSSLLVT